MRTKTFELVPKEAINFLNFPPLGLVEVLKSLLTQEWQQCYCFDPFLMCLKECQLYEVGLVSVSQHLECPHVNMLVYSQTRNVTPYEFHQMG